MTEYPPPIDGLVAEHADGVLRLRLDRPHRRNSITDDMVAALTDSVEAAGGDESVRVIHLSGTGDHFCSGFDLGLRGGDEPKPRVGSTQRRMRRQVNRLIPAMLETQTPIVAAVQGWCIGLGLHLALASDFAVVAEDARLWSPFTGAGFTPDSGGSWILPRMAGVARAKDMLMLGRKVSGAEAAAWGMVHMAVPSDEVADVVDALAGELAGAATVALGLTKLLVHRGLTATLDQHLADEAFAIELSSRSEDFQESGRARREERRPEFGGR